MKTKKQKQNIIVAQVTIEKLADTNKIIQKEFIHMDKLRAILLIILNSNLKEIAKLHNILMKNGDLEE